ncbi:LamG-like jellyroll fold domain-containing protein [Streptomyces sp. NPDC054871]
MPLLIEAGWGGLVQAPTTITWTDITQYVDTVQGVSVTRGASDERAETQPGQASLVLDNADGRFTPGNTGSPYYPFVRRNAPIRVSVAVIPARTGSAPYPLAMLGDDFDDERIDSALWANAYGGVSEVGGRARVPLNPGVVAGYQTARQWTLTGSKITAKLCRVPAANGSSAASASMWINSTTSGTRLGWTYNPLTNVLSCQSQTSFFDGTPVSMTYSAIDHAWLRVREAAGVLYWESSGDGFGWTIRRYAATPAWVGAQTQLVDFSATRTGGTTDYIEWDLVGAEIRPRFWGMVNEFPVEWEGLYSKVGITCTDLFKRLNRLPPLRSMLAEEILHHDDPNYYDQLDAYFPLVEPADSTSAGDVSGRGCGALAITQAGAGGTLEFGSDGLPATEDTSVTFTPVSASAGKYLAADLGATFEEADNHRTLMMEAWIKTTTPGRAILGLYESNLDHQIVLTLTAGGVLAVESIDDGRPLWIATTSSANLADGQWHHIVHDNWTKTCYVDGVQVGTGLPIWTTYGMRYLHVGGYRGGRLFSGQIAHVAFSHGNGAIGATLAAHYEAGTTAHAGEPADDRIRRLARYAGLESVTVWGATHDPVSGQGGGGTGVVARMREIETTEAGRLFVERDWYGIAYQSRDVRYNPSPASETFTIDYADLEPGTNLADDDQKMVNVVEASRPGGATQRASAPASVDAFGPYEAQLEILKASDNSVLDAAYWLVSRYADPQPELREVAIEAYTMPTYLDILDAEISSYFSVYNLPAQAPASTLRVTVEGYTETIKDRSHIIQFHTSASITDSVWVLDDPVYSVLDTSTRLAY